MSLKKKIGAIFDYRSKTVEDYSKVDGTSVQNIYRKLRTSTLSLRDLIAMCEYLNMKVVITDDTMYIPLTPEDVEKVDNRSKNGANFGTVKD